MTVEEVDEARSHELTSSRKLAPPEGATHDEAPHRPRRRLRPRQDRRPRPEGPEGPLKRQHHKPHFQGGQTPMQRRLPKRGFRNPFADESSPTSTSASSSVFAAGAEVDEAALREARPRPGPLRPHQGPRQRRAHQEAHRHRARFSKSARRRRSRRPAARPSSCAARRRVARRRPSAASGRPQRPCMAVLAGIRATSTRCRSSGAACSSRW